MFPERESLVVSPTSRALSFGWAPYKAREVWAGAVAKHLLRPRARCSSPRPAPRRFRKQGQHSDAVATGSGRLGRCTAGRSYYIRISRCKGKLALAAIYLRRDRVSSRITAGAPPLKHIFTVGACGTRPRRGPPAALPGQAIGDMLGAMVRIAPPQDFEAIYFVDSSQRFEGGLGEKSG